MSAGGVKVRAADARLGAGAGLVADVGRGGCVVADEHGGEVRDGPAGVDVRAYADRYFAADLGRDRVAVDDGGGHGRSIAGRAC